MPPKRQGRRLHSMPLPKRQTRRAATGAPSAGRHLSACRHFRRRPGVPALAGVPALLREGPNGHSRTQGPPMVTPDPWSITVKLTVIFRCAGDLRELAVNDTANFTIGGRFGGICGK
ncbi:hypothetical protein [Paenibacillus sp. J14]|uniref:hypothetical protein n=1 Tax=Paenibacillus sp. (strain J14) TaxID=935845 RepID=UPI0012F9784A|nr:hypothetical protein [Paenibacillus sp. J14]